MPQVWPRGPWNELHQAADDGSIEGMLSVLRNGSIHIDQGNPVGSTALMLAAIEGHSRITRVLLDKGANFAIASDIGYTALHCSAQSGHVAVTKMLTAAGADLEAAHIGGSTPLHVAAATGQCEAMVVLIEAGANVDSHGPNGETPMYLAAGSGHVSATIELLRAKADPLLAKENLGGADYVPLDIAACEGHSW